MAPSSRVWCWHSPLLDIAVCFKESGLSHHSEGQIKQGGSEFKITEELRPPLSAASSPRPFLSKAGAKLSHPHPALQAGSHLPFATDPLLFETGFADFLDLHIGSPGRS